MRSVIEGLKDLRRGATTCRQSADEVLDGLGLKSPEKTFEQAILPPTMGQLPAPVEINTALPENLALNHAESDLCLTAEFGTASAMFQSIPAETESSLGNSGDLLARDDQQIFSKASSSGSKVSKASSGGSKASSTVLSTLSPRETERSRLHQAITAWIAENDSPARPCRLWLVNHRTASSGNYLVDWGFGEVEAVRVELLHRQQSMAEDIMVQREGEGATWERIEDFFKSTRPTREGGIGQTNGPRKAEDEREDSGRIYGSLIEI